MANPEMGSREPEEEIPQQADHNEGDKKISRRNFLKTAIGVVVGASAVAGGLELASRHNKDESKNKNPEKEHPLKTDTVESISKENVSIVLDKKGNVTSFFVKDGGNVAETIKMVKETGYELRDVVKIFDEKGTYIWVEPRALDIKSLNLASEKRSKGDKKSKEDPDVEFIDGLLKKYKNKINK